MGLWQFVKATAFLHHIKVQPEVWRMVCQEHVDGTQLLLCMVTHIPPYKHVVVDSIGVVMKGGNYKL